MPVLGHPYGLQQASSRIYGLEAPYFMSFPSKVTGLPMEGKSSVNCNGFPVYWKLAPPDSLGYKSFWAAFSSSRLAAIFLSAAFRSWLYSTAIDLYFSSRGFCWDTATEETHNENKTSIYFFNIITILLLYRT